MWSLLFTVFIYPLELFMVLVLEGMIAITSAPLFALIVMSFVVTLASLPFYHIAERWQDQERAIRKKLKPKEDEFKSIFTGAVLYTYLRTLYRQHRYHPIYAVRSSFGLMIQIPFFFAAYHLLSNYTPFVGVESALFTDLSKPDGWVQWGSISINVMPFVMTGINLISVFVYGEKMSWKENAQLYGIALLFLVVLYNSPSALLFYWTFNNLFSLLKNIIYRLLYHQGELTTQKSFEPKEKAHPRLGIIYHRRPRVRMQILMVLLVVTCLFLAPRWLTSRAVASQAMYFLSLLLLVRLNFYPCLSFFTTSLKKHRIPLMFVYCGTYLTGLTLSILWIFEITKTTSTLRTASLSVLGGLFAFHLLCKIFGWLNNVVKEKQLQPAPFGQTLFLLALSNLGCLIFIAAPLSLLASGSIRDFDNTLVYYVSFMLMLFVVFSTLLLVVHAYLSESAKTVMLYVVSTLTVYALVNVFLFTGNYGDMSHLLFTKGIQVNNTTQLLNLLALLAIAATLWLLFYKKKASSLVSFFAICLLTLTTFSVKEGYKYYGNRTGVRATEAKKLDTMFRFSKNQNNVLIVMMDRFIGGYVPQALKFLPALKKQLDGFVWYSNTLSPGSNTINGLPAILGGWDYYTPTLHSTRKKVTLRQKLNESIRVTPYNFAKAGYGVSIFDPPTMFFNARDKTHLKNVRVARLLGRYRKVWLAEKKINLSKSKIREKLAMFGLFRAAPPMFRLSIYDKGKWIVGRIPSKSTKKKKGFVSFVERSRNNIKTVLDEWSVLDYLPRISKASSSFPKQFHVFITDFTHNPLATTSKFDISMGERIYYPKKIYNQFGKNLSSLKHLYTDTAALKQLAKWFEWMKKNGVYDNTRIILVSDHGRDVYSPMFNQQEIPGAKMFYGKRFYASSFHPLLLVKDFNSRGGVKRNKEFMSLNDVPYLAMKKLLKGINPYTKNPIKKREKKLPFRVIWAPWRMDQQKKHTFKVTQEYEISKANIFNVQNWKVVKK